MVHMNSGAVAPRPATEDLITQADNLGAVLPGGDSANPLQAEVSEAGHAGLQAAAAMSKPGNMDQILPQIAFTNFKNAPTDAARADAWLDSVA